MKLEYYRILGIGVGADLKTIKQAYRKLAKFYHPDKYPTQSKETEEAAEKMKEISEAYNELKRGYTKDNTINKESNNQKNQATKPQTNWNWGGSKFNSQRKESEDYSFYNHGFGAKFDSFYNRKSAREIFKEMNKSPKKNNTDDLFKQAEKAFEKNFKKKDLDFE